MTPEINALVELCDKQIASGIEGLRQIYLREEFRGLDLDFSTFIQMHFAIDHSAAQKLIDLANKYHK
jgi:hypothetical protein